jgi:hypothetical protein
MGELKSAYKIVVRNLMGKDHFRDIVIAGKIILRKILEKYGMRVLTWPVPMAELSEAHTVFNHSNTGIMGSNPT